VQGVQAGEARRVLQLQPSALKTTAVFQAEAGQAARTAPDQTIQLTLRHFMS
jgi:hypothetical protein